MESKGERSMTEAQKAKRYLQKIEEMDRQILSDEVRIREMEADARTLRAVRMDGMPRSGSDATGAAFEAAIAEIDRRRERMAGAIMEKQAVIERLTGEIRGMENKTYARILELRYVRYREFPNLWEVAREMKYSYEWIKHIHGDALVAFWRSVHDSPTSVTPLACHLLPEEKARTGEEAGAKKK